LPKTQSSAAGSAPILALPNTGTPSAIAHKISLCQTEGAPEKEAVDDPDRARAPRHGAIDVALRDRRQVDEGPRRFDLSRRERRTHEDHRGDEPLAWMARALGPGTYCAR
jgi:hypothetical protein